MKPLPIQFMDDECRQRFNKKIYRHPNGCWIWTGATSLGEENGKGVYPHFGIRGSVYKGNRVAYYFATGNDPGENNILHNCYPNKDNPLCVNPNHLRLGDLSENSQDRWNKNPVKIRGNKICLFDVYTIREMYKEGFSKKVIAQLYKLNIDYTSKILRFMVWPNVTKELAINCNCQKCRLL